MVLVTSGVEGGLITIHDDLRLTSLTSLYIDQKLYSQIFNFLLLENLAHASCDICVGYVEHKVVVVHISGWYKKCSAYYRASENEFDLCFLEFSKAQEAMIFVLL